MKVTRMYDYLALFFYMIPAMNDYLALVSMKVVYPEFVII